MKGVQRAWRGRRKPLKKMGSSPANDVSVEGEALAKGLASGWGDLKPASTASVEGEAPSGSAGGGGDASPYK